VSVRLAVEQIAERLGDRFGLLTHGIRTALPRHQTLQGAIDWSYELLSAPERSLFTGLSVFAGGWSLDAAETVGAACGLTRTSVLDLLTQLIDKSLVTTSSATEGSVRYDMLETLRQYGNERLGRSSRARTVQRAHADFFVASGGGGGRRVGRPRPKPSG